MLVHICCSVDSHYFLQKIKEDFPDEEIVGYFYDPNIHPYLEYKLRLMDVQRSCDLLGVKLIEGEYDFENWLKISSPHANEPEKGKRCSLCFDYRFENSAKKALELNMKTFTTTLLMSPKKSLIQIEIEAKAVSEKYNLDFLMVDYRKNNGTQMQMQTSKENKLYHQNYCGCIFGLANQKQTKAHELYSPINNDTLDCSIDEKILIYKTRLELEQNNIDYMIRKVQVFSYRQLIFRVLIDSKKTLGFALHNSVLKSKITAKILNMIDDVAYFDKLGIIGIPLSKYNSLNNKNFKNIISLVYQKDKLLDEQNTRMQLTKSISSTNLIFVGERFEKNLNYIFELSSYIFEDTREYLVTFN